MTCVTVYVALAIPLLAMLLIVALGFGWTFPQEIPGYASIAEIADDLNLTYVAIALFLLAGTVGLTLLLVQQKIVSALASRTKSRLKSDDPGFGRVRAMRQICRPCSTTDVALKE